MKNEMKNLVEEKSFAFAVRIVRLSRYLTDNKHEFVISRQVLKSGTSIGANICEAQKAQSKADFISKMQISLKETAETKYWLRLLCASDILTANSIRSLYAECSELEKLLNSIIKTAKERQK